MTRPSSRSFCFSGGCTAQPQLERFGAGGLGCGGRLFDATDRCWSPSACGKSLAGLEFPGGKIEALSRRRPR